MRAGIAVVALALACGRPEATPDEHPKAAAVPGVETAVATAGPVRDVVRALGTVAAEGEPAEVRDARTALAEAEARRSLAAQQVRRLESLAGGVAPQKELEAARAEEASAAAAATRARGVLSAFGRDAGRVALDPGDRWLIARVMQVDVPRIDAGGDATFVADALPAEHFTATVDSAPAYVDAATQTAPVRLRVRDPGGRLRPGMTGVAALEVGAPREAVVVPGNAVVYDDARTLVFVAEDGRYAPRPVRLGVSRDGRVEIADGLAAGERIVVTGAASLLSQARLPASDEAD